MVDRVRSVLSPVGKMTPLFGNLFSSFFRNRLIFSGSLSIPGVRENTLQYFECIIRALGLLVAQYMSIPRLPRFRAIPSPFDPFPPMIIAGFLVTVYRVCFLGILSD